MSLNNRSILLLFICWLIPVSGVMGQKAPIRGTVTTVNGHPVSGAQVILKENKEIWTFTNDKGRFKIDADQGQHLKIIDEGHKSQTITVQGSSVSVTLSGSGRTIPLGYEITRTPEDITAATGMIGSQQIMKSRVINPNNALYGRIPGLTVLQNGGMPYTNPGMYVRGRGTFTDSSPLVLVDGLERHVAELTTEEIRSVTVLKDAAALAKYGQRGANGVIMFKTKRGRPGKVDINATYEIGFTKSTALPDFLSAPYYARAYNEALANDGRILRYDKRDIQNFDSGKPSVFYPDVNWFDKVLRPSGTNSNFNTTFEGGNDNIRYFTALHYVGDNGIFGPVSQHKDYSTQAKYSRFNLRTNLDIDVTNQLLFRLDVAGNVEENNVPGGGGGEDRIFNALYSTPSAAYPVRNPDGSFGGTQIYDNNPYAQLTSTGYGQPNSRELFLTGELKRDMSDVLDGLTAGITLSYSNFGNFNERHTKNFKYTELQPDRNKNGQITDTIRTSYGQKTSLGFNDSFGYERRFTDLVARLNYETSFNNSSLEATAFFHQSNRVFDGKNNVDRRQNFAGNVHYSIENTYFFDATASYSGNNHMNPDDRFDWFPAVSAGWMISNEDFMKNTDFLTRLKLRASWGIVGSDRIPNPTAQPYVHAFRISSGYHFQRSNNSYGGFGEASLPTPNFTFERSHKTNVGIDASFFGKLFFDADAFYDRRTDILTSSVGKYSQSLGIAAPLRTDGIVTNRGFETSLTWKDQAGKVSYHIGGQMSYAHNEIEEMDEQVRPNDYLRRTGQQVGQEFGLQAIGFFEDQQDIANSPSQQFSNVQPGDIQYKDQNGDKIINSNDQVPLGYSSGYPEIYFSANVGVKYKGFSVSALFQGTGHYTAYLNTESVFWPLRNNNTISNYYYNHRWTPSTASNARFPRLTTEGNANNFRPNSVWLVDRSYIKLRTLNISYLLPHTVTEPLHVHAIKVFGRGMNLFSIDNIPVLDPERLAAGYPILKSYNLGFKISF